MRLLLTFTPLFLAVTLLQLSTGGVGPLDALSGLALNFTTGQIGLLGSAHFVGFFMGSWWAPRLMGEIGHIRTFAAFTVAGTVGLLAHMLLIDAYAWAMMRVMTGLCVAGCYTVIEAWLHARLTNKVRGRAMGGYRLVDMTGSLLAQTMIAVLEPANYVSYNVLAILCCAALLPLVLTTKQQPHTPPSPRLRPLLAVRLSPLAAVGVVATAVSSASFRMIGPVYGQEVGLSTDQIAWFLAAFVLGGALAQYPAGWLADRFDRRWVLTWLSIAAIAASILTVATNAMGAAAVMWSALIFGATTFPIYSVSAAHAHDFADDSERIELSAALTFFYALGAMAAPLLASILIAQLGPAAMFAMVALVHLGLIVFGLIRMRIRPTRKHRTPYLYVPRTSFLIGRLLRRPRDDI